MPKKAKRHSRQIIIDSIAAIVAVVLIGFGLWNIFNKPAKLCATPGQEHRVTLQNDTFSVNTLSLKQCDVIRIVNLDTQSYDLAFGVHEKHVEYPGFSQIVVGPNEFITVDALQAGNFRIHDHLRDKAAIELAIEAEAR